MKKILTISLALLMLAAINGLAQMDGGMKGEQKGEMNHPCMKKDGGMMPMMEKCKPMMKQMMGDKKEMMQMMMDMMTMQETMMKGPNAAEKKQMMKDMAQMKEKMQKKMSMPMDMKCMDDSESEYPSKTEQHKH